MSLFQPSLRATLLLLLLNPACFLTGNTIVHDDFENLDNWTLMFQEGYGSMEARQSKLEYIARGLASEEVAGLVHQHDLPQNEDWLIVVDVHLVAEGKSGGWSNLTLAITNSNDFDDHLAMAIDRNGLNGKGIEHYFRVNGSVIRQPYSNTTTVDASFRIMYDSQSGALATDCDFTGPADGYSWEPQLSVNIANSPTKWNMDAQDTFEIYLIGGSGGRFRLNSGDAHFDHLRTLIGPASLHINDFDQDSPSGDLTLSFNGFPNTNYQVMRSADLDFSDRSPTPLVQAAIGQLQGDGFTTDGDGVGVVSLSPPGGVKSMFYRVEIPQPGN